MYTRRLRQRIGSGPLPRHVGLIMDGNRRWARQVGMSNPSLGHKYGAEHLQDALAWCNGVGIKHLTVFVCSTENLQRRGDAEVAYLMQTMETLVTERIAKGDKSWQIHVAGMLDVLPTSTAQALKDAVEFTRDCTTGAHLNLAIGYGGRQEVVEAVRDLLYERAERGQSLAQVAEDFAASDIGAHLYTADQPEPDLIIRTSGEMRTSNFLLWQSTHSELYFCDAYWPAFREIDFLRALRSYAGRKSRLNSGG